MPDGQISLTIVAVAGGVMATAITKLFATIVASSKAEIDRITAQNDREVARLEATIERLQGMLFKSLGAAEGFSEVARTQANQVKQLHGEAP